MAQAHRSGVQPVIAARYDLASVAEAHRAVVEESFLGTLVVEP